MLLLLFSSIFLIQFSDLSRNSESYPLWSAHFGICVERAHQCRLTRWVQNIIYEYYYYVYKQLITLSVHLYSIVLSIITVLWIEWEQNNKKKQYVVCVIWHYFSWRTMLLLYYLLFFILFYFLILSRALGHNTLLIHPYETSLIIMLLLLLLLLLLLFDVLL